MKRISLVTIITSFIFIFGCNQGQKPTHQPTVTVSIIPQQFFVNQIAGNWLRVNVMIPPGGNPHSYEPTPMQMKDLSNSDAYFRIGYITFEAAWMDKLISVNQQMKVIDTSEGLDLITEEGNPEPKHDSETHSEHAGVNPHIWLSPRLVKQEVETIYKTLVALYPEHAPEMQQNFNRFESQIDSTAQSLHQTLSKASGTSFIVYHPVWTYLAHDYQLNQVAIEENGKEATAERLKHIIDFAREKQIHIIFIQKEFSNAQAKTIASEIDGSIATMDPLDYNWFNTMKVFGEAFQPVHNE